MYLCAIFVSLVALASAKTPRRLNNAIDRDCAGIHLGDQHQIDVLSLSGVETSLSNTSFCNLTVTATHPGENDFVIMTIWLPLANWNGRFLALGGGGLSAEASAGAMQSPLSQGWAVGSTDAGLSLNRTINSGTGQWLLRDGESNLSHVTNFAHRSIHDMTTLGKAAVVSFYQKPAHHAYYSGCSTGGRQGYFAAQYHPDDFDGILANAPAIHTPRISPGTFWASVVMGNIVAPPQCVFGAYVDAILEHCDPLDGVEDGLITLPEKCDFDPHRALVGTAVECSDTGFPVTITDEHATVISKVLQGPRSASGNQLFYGIPPGASFSGQANTRTVNGTTVPVPFGAGETWMGTFVAQDPSLDTASLTFEEYEALFDRSVELYTENLGTTNPDLTSFKGAGGKLLTWHGLADPLITHEGTIEYWHSLHWSMGDDGLDYFYRIFFAPGAGHCSGGYGPLPVDPLAALVGWVEKEEAPDTLFAQATAGGRNITRDLCRYPSTLAYKGSGDVDSAGSFACKACAS